MIQAFDESVAEMSVGDVLPESHCAEASRAIVPAAPRANVAPITESQLEILLSAKLSPEANCSYNEAFTVDLQGPVNRGALIHSLKMLVQRHEILTATFDLETKTIRFPETAGVAIEEFDFSGSARIRRSLSPTS